MLTWERPLWWSDGNQRETLLSGDLLFQAAPGTFDNTRSFLFSSRNEFNATRQKRDLVTAEVGYTSSSLFCSGPLPSLQMSLCREKDYGNRRTVRRSSYSPPAHLAWAVASCLHSPSAKRPVDDLPCWADWCTPWEINLGHLCLLWGWTECPGKLFVFVRGTMAAPLARFPLGHGALVAPAWLWFPLPWPQHCLSAASQQCCAEIQS